MVSGTLGTRTFQQHWGCEATWKKKHTDVKSEREIQGLQGSSPAPSKPRNVSVFGGVKSSPTVRHRKRTLCPDHAVSLADSFTSMSKDNNTSQASGTLGIAGTQLLGLDLPSGNKKQGDARKGPIWATCLMGHRPQGASGEGKGISYGFCSNPEDFSLQDGANMIFQKTRVWLHGGSQRSPNWLRICCEWS